MTPTKTYYGDSRMNNICAFCGNFADTEDHVPSRCFLDEPHPNNLPVIPCCYKCNHEFSNDEEYVSCMIDCMKANSTEPSMIQREKTRRTLIHSPKLQERIKSQIRDFGGCHVYDIETNRFNKVIRKLAFGHLAYENNMLSWDSDYNITMRILPEMTDSQKSSFFQPYMGKLLPEVGSHALEHVAFFANYTNDSFASSWITVQEGRYIYCVSPDGDAVKFVIADYLAVEVQIDLSN